MELKDRVQMNSKGLQEKYPEVYREIFSKSFLVVSAPGNFWWAGEHAAIYGGLAIKQNIPLRAYVGLEKVTEPKVEVMNWCHYTPSKKQFEIYQSNTNIRPKNISRFLTAELLRENPKINWGFKIQSLFEVPLSCGLSTSGSFGMATALAFYLALDQISLAEVKQWQQQSAKDVLSNKNFDKVFRLAWKIESIIHSGSSSGAGPFASFFNSVYPLIFFSEKRAAQAETTNKFKPLNVGNNYDLINDIKYYGIKMEELFDLKESPHWSLDFALFYSGKQSDTGGVIMSLGEMQEIIDSRLDFTSKIFGKYQEKLDEIKPLFIDCLQERGSQSWNTFNKALNIAVIIMLGAFYELFKKHSTESRRSILRTMNMYHYGLNMLGLSSPPLNRVIFALKDKISKLDGHFGCGAKATGAARFGDAVIGLVLDGQQEEVHEVLAQISKEFPGSGLDYASWLDGYEEEGAKVEQFIEQGIYSNFVSGSSVVYSHIDKSGRTNEKVSNEEEFNKAKEATDLLLDKVKNQVFVRGQRLTSKEIPSAITAVELLDILFSNLGKNITNTSLPKSSYTEDRNELQSKIITPLNQVLRERLNKELPIKINGGIRNFLVRLDKPGLEVCIVKKLL